MGSVTKHKRGLVSQSGFTLIEILIVMGIIAMLATIVIVAINPARQFAQARESQRISNINSILNAIGERIADNKGIFASSGACPTIPTATSTIDYSGGIVTGGHLDLATNCLVPTYISSLPSDPSGPVAPSTGYEVSTDGAGRVTVCAPQAAEAALVGSAVICVTR